MTASGDKGFARHDKPNATRPVRRVWLLAAGIILLAAVLGLAFVGYRQPELLLDYVNLRYCG